MAGRHLWYPAISQFLMADISFNIACKELKIVQIAQLNQLFQALNLVRIYGHGFYDLSRVLMRKNVSNDVSKDSPTGRHGKGEGEFRPRGRHSRTVWMEV